MSIFLNWRYWFSLYPGTWQNWGKVFLYISLGLLLLAIVFLFLSWKKELPSLYIKFFKKISLGAGILGALSLLYWFFREQGVPFFSSRFWLALLLLGAIWWLIWLVLWFIKRKNARQALQEREVVYDKYLPGHKQ